MRRTSVLVALLAGMALAIPTLNDPGLAPQDNSCLAVPVAGVTDDQTGPSGTSIVAESAEPDYLLTTGSPGNREKVDDALKIGPFMDWGDDVLVDDLNESPTSGKIATDVEQDGTIWAAILDPDGGSTNDTIWHYYSTDGGLNWTYWNFIGGPSGDIRDFDLVVGTHGGTDYVYTFVVYDGSAGLYCRYLAAADGGSFGWTQIAPGDSWAEVSADRNIETPQHVFCGWISQGGAVKLESSSDGCVTFGNHRNVTSGRRNPAVCAGGGGYVYLAFLDAADSTYWRTVRYTNNLVSPTWVFVSVDQGADNRFHRVSIAADRTAPGTSQTAIGFATYEYEPNGNIGPRYGWTTNGGETYSSSFWPPTNQSRATWDMRWPYIRRSYYDESAKLFRAVVTVPEPTASWDTIVYAYSRPESPTTWEARAEPNDHRITGEFGAKLDWSTDIDGGGYIVYREFGSTEIWVDGWNWTGVAEGERPTQPGELRAATFVARDGAVSLSLPGRARVDAVLFDGAGRRVREVFSGSLDAGQHQLPVGDLARGLYFIQLDINGSTQTAKLVNVN